MIGKKSMIVKMKGKTKVYFRALLSWSGRYQEGLRVGEWIIS